MGELQTSRNPDSSKPSLRPAQWFSAVAVLAPLLAVAWACAPAIGSGVDYESGPDRASAGAQAEAAEEETTMTGSDESAFDLQAAWSEVERLVGEQKFQVASERVREILTVARSRGDQDNWTRAIIEWVQLETGLHGYEKAVRLLRSEPWPDDARSVAALELYYAQGLIHYLQVYSWEIRQREQMASTEEVDLRSWTAQEIVDEAHRAYARVWSAREALGKLDLAVLSRYLSPNNYPATIRGSLRDAVTYLWVELLADSSFWSAQESNEAYRLNLQSLLAVAEPAELAGLEAHPALRLTKLLGDLEHWHFEAKRFEAASEARLERLRRLHGIFSAADDRLEITDNLRQHLKSLGDRFPWWSMGMSQLAEFVRSTDDPWALVEARKIALEGAERHPESIGAQRCRHIVASIEAPAYSVTSMSIDAASRRSIEVQHKNLEALYFRAYSLDLFDLIRGSRDYQLLPAYNEVEKLIAQREPRASWSTQLPETPDYREHRSFAVPELPEKGLYLVVASARPSFEAPDNELRAFYFNRSDAVILSREEQGKLEVSVVSGETGEAIPGSEVHLFRYDYGRKGHKRTDLARTGSDGRVVFDRSRDGNGYFLLARNGDDVALDEGRHYFGSRNRERTVQGSFVYTDRSIYRPGQQIKWKAVGYHGTHSSGDFEVLAKQPITVELYDANGELVARTENRTNEYGSVAGAFDIPVGRLLGNWSLSTSLDGAASVRVEEYKRPTFETTLDAPKAALRLNRPASLSGEARYYFGLPVVDGEVDWRVTREPVYPGWWWWFYPSPNTDVQTIASGTVELDEDGAFAIAFLPEADEREAERGVSYRFRVAIEATDSGGETARAERSFRLGFVAVEATISSENDFVVAGEPAAFVVQRSDLDGAARPGSGSWRLTRLEQPDRTPLPADIPLSEQPTDAVARAAFETPGDRLRARWQSMPERPQILRHWRDGAEVAAGVLQHGEDGAAALDLEPLEPGAYRLRYTTDDAFGAEFATQSDFVVAATRRTSLALPLVLASEASSVPVGEVARILVHSGLEDQAMVFEVFRKGKRVRREVLSSEQGVRILEFPVTEADRGGLGLRLTAVRDHQLMTLTDAIFVPWDDRKLEIEFATFRDLLRPGGRETWRVKVKGLESDLAASSAELLAYMYDRSLDVFAAHQPPEPLGIYPAWGAPQIVSTNLSANSPVWQEGSLASLPGYPHLRSDRLEFLSGYGIGGLGRRNLQKMRSMREGVMMEKLAMPASAGGQLAYVSAEADADIAQEETIVVSAESAPPASSGAPQLRADFSETAFWHPNLLLEPDGSVAFEFEVPDSVTEWNLWVHALTRDLRAGRATQRVKTVKELLVRPYLPRFLREGDHAQLRVVVQNAGEETLTGELDIAILDPGTDESLLESFAVASVSGGERAFSIEPGKSWTYELAVETPARLGEVAFQVHGRAGEFSDGEQRSLPILPGRMHLAQSRFVTLNDEDRETMHFADLARDDDPTRIDEQLVVTLDTQLFYSVLSALPYLVDYPYECTEQTLNRFLSTGIVSTLYDDYPAVERMAKEFSERDSRFEPWQADDPNRKMTLEETPWVGASKGGRESSQDLINVLDPKIAKAQRKAALTKLEKAQTAIGGFPWFPGGPPSPYITLYLLDGFSRALEFGVEVPEPMIRRAWGYMHRHYIERVIEDMIAEDCCWEFVTFLSYVLSSYPDESWTGGAFTADERSRMLAFSFGHWTRHSPRLKAQLALTLERAGRPKDARLVFDSVMDSAKTSEELGTYWAPEERAWLWYNDTIESHAFALRTLTELDEDDARREGLVQWLLLNKKLGHWKSTRATAEVIYSLVHYLQHEGTLAVREEVQVAVGSREAEVFVFDPDEYTGKNNQVLVAGDEIDPATDSTIVVEKSTPGFAFASATWHFSTEELPAEARGDFFEAQRTYFRRVSGSQGFQLEPLAEGARVEVGDQVEVHISIRAKHAAEYVHLRDPRPAGFEPERSTSGYQWDLGLVRYEEVRDSGMNFFFERLPVGEYTMKHRLRAATAGTFQSAPATLQSMYAPEFTAYSTGERLTILP